MQIYDVSITELTPYAKNPRKNDFAVDATAASIKEFGFKVPLVIDRNNVIVAGHTRLKAAIRLGLKTVPCVIADDLTDEQVKAFRLADNKTGELANWDMQLLSEELAEITEFDMSLFAFDPEKLQADNEWFKDREQEGKSHEDGNEEYNNFVDKFEQKKTTDDCYTPAIVYDAISKWVQNEYGVNASTFIRPFYPGGGLHKRKIPAWLHSDGQPAIFNTGGNRAILYRAEYPLFSFRAIIDHLFFFFFFVCRCSRRRNYV